MMLNFEKLAWGFNRLRAGRRPCLEEVASRTWEICPEETGTIPSAIYLDGALDKITGFSPWTSWEYEEAKLFGGTVTHAASTAHLLRDARISGAWVYHGAFKAQHGFGEESLIKHGASEFQRIDEAHLVSNSPGSNFFGCYVRDDLPLGLVPQPDDHAIVLRTKDYEHEAGYRRLLDLPRPPLVHAACVDELVIYTDFAQNTSKADRYAELRQRMRAALVDAEPPASRMVYLKRGATGETRLIQNEAELEQHLCALGFEVVEPSTLSAEEICRRMLDIRLVVSVEGSHLAHSIYGLADHGAFLVLQPPDRFATPYKEFADRMEMPFAFLVGDPAENGFTVDLDDLDRLLDRLA